MFQTLQLHDFERQLKLTVDSASPLAFVNSKTWHDLDKPRLQSTTKVLGAFEGQPINPLGYFEARVVRPLPEELFQSLNEGSKFSEIYLADAYLQIELAKESKN